MNSPDPKAVEQEIIESLDSPLASVPHFKGPVGRLVGWIDALFMGLAVSALVAIAITVLLQISGRLFLPFTLAWTEELSRYLFVYMVALSAGVVLRQNRNVNVELFHHRLGPRARAGYQALVCLVVGVFAYIVLPYAWIYAQNAAWQSSPTLKIPMLYVFFSTVVLFGLLLVYSVLGFLEGLVAMFRQPDNDTVETP